MAGKCKFQVGDIIIIVDHGTNRFQDGDMGTLVKYIDRPWWQIKVGWSISLPTTVTSVMTTYSVLNGVSVWRQTRRFRNGHSWG